MSQSPFARRLELFGSTLARWNTVVTVTILAIAVFGWYLLNRRDAAVYAKQPVVFQSNTVFLICGILGAGLIWLLGHANSIARSASNTAIHQHIREEEDRVSFSSSAQAMWICDLDTLRIVDANHAALKLYGYAHEEFTSLRVTDLHPPEGLPAALGVADAHSGLNIWSPRYHRRKDRTSMLVDKCGYVFYAGGRRFGLVSVVPLLSGSADLAADNRGMSPATETAPFGVVRASLMEDRLLGFNQAMMEVLGYSKSEEIGEVMDARPFYHNLTDRDRLLQLLRAGRAIVDFQLQLQTKHGEPVRVSVSAQLQCDEQGSPSTIEACVRLVDRMLPPKAGLGSATEMVEH